VNLADKHWRSWCCTAPPIAESLATTDDRFERVGLCSACFDWSSFSPEETEEVEAA